MRRSDVASSATAVVVRAVEAVGIKRYIAISAGMVALDWPLFKYVLRPLIFRHILAEHNRVEAIVKATPLDWTIVRPTALANHPAKGYTASLEPLRRMLLRHVAMSQLASPTSWSAISIFARRSSLPPAEIVSGDPYDSGAGRDEHFRRCAARSS